MAPTFSSTNIETSPSGWVTYGNGEYLTSAGSSVSISRKPKCDPSIVFKLIKKKFGVLGQYRYESRIKKLEALCNKYLESGQYAFAEKIMNKISEEVKLAELVGAGIKMCLDISVMQKFKNVTRDGHIADTPFEKYTRPIPDDVLAKKKNLDKLKVFDEYVIYHYWNDEVEAKKERKEKVSNKERSDMRDPILFGKSYVIPDKLFFIADWDCDYCHLTFDEIVDALDLENDDVKIPKLKEL